MLQTATNAATLSPGTSRAQEAHIVAYIDKLIDSVHLMGDADPSIRSTVDTVLENLISRRKSQAKWWNDADAG